MSASQSTLQSDPQEIFDTFGKGAYFTSSNVLYYVLDVLIDNDYYLLEDCYNNKKYMITQQEFELMKKTRIEVAAA